MSHLIENNMIAWKGATPWHGLGVSVDANMSGLEMLAKAKMDWKVQRRALAMRGADGQGLITDPLKNFRAIVREDTNEVFQVATDRYHPMQNAQVVEFFKEYCEAGHATMEVVGGLKGGAIVWALAKLNGGSDAVIGGVDDMKGYMMLATSHDGSLRTIGQATNVRVVCWNTLSAAINTGERSNQFMMKHSSKWTAARADEARKTMGMAIEQISNENLVIEKLSRVSIDDRGREQYIMRLLGGETLLDQVVNDQTANHAAMGASVMESILHADVAKREGDATTDLGRLGKAILEAMTNSPGSELVTAKNTLWGAVNGVTYHVDHERGRSQDTRLAGAWFGDGDRLKRDAVKVACEIAGINLDTRQTVYA